MPRPRAELRGRLRYRGCGPGPRLSLLHVRLSAAAERALRGCGRRQGEPGPVIAFQGSQGCLTVPGDPGTPPRLFAFSLSRCGRDEPRGSFECVRLAEPRLGQSWLHSLGSIQEKITVCAWETTRCLSLAKEPCSRAVVEPDLAVLGYGKGITTSEKVGVTDLLGKGSVCHLHVPTTASPRASRQRLAQPRALQPHPKHRLEGTPAGRPGRAQLLVAPEEMQEQAATSPWVREHCSTATLLRSPREAGMDPGACCCHGKETLVGRAQEDWPGTMAQEQQRDAPLQRRSRDCGPSALSFLVPLQQPLEHGSPRATTRNLLGVKHLALLDSSDPGASERHQSCPWMLSTQHPGPWGQQQAGPLAPSSHAGELAIPRSEEERGDGWEERARRPEQHLSVPRDARPQATSSSLAEVPDYLCRYRTICSWEQRRAYEAAFSADYGEYRSLHARVGSVSRRFTQLGAKMKMLKQGTKERKALEAAIVHEYRHFKKTYPSYQQEKNRCEYLHQKLSHIKSLVLQFEGSESS